MVAYGRVIEEERTIILAYFATTNPWVYITKTDMTEDEVKQIEIRATWMLRTISAKQGTPNINETIVFSAPQPAETEEELMGTFEKVEFVGDYMDITECLYRIHKKINSYFAPEPSVRENIMSLVAQLIDATTYNDREKMSRLQSTIQDEYKGTPMEGQANILCKMIREGEKLMRVYKHADLLKATQEENYEKAGEIKKSLDNHAQDI